MTEPVKQLAVVPADTGSRLGQLIAERAQLAPAVKAASERLDEINAAIKGELTRARPDSVDTLAVAEGLPALRFYAKPTRRLNQKRLLAERPDIHAQYYEAGTAWTLEVKR